MNGAGSICKECGSVVEAEMWGISGNELDWSKKNLCYDCDYKQRIEYQKAMDEKHKYWFCE